MATSTAGGAAGVQAQEQGQQAAAAMTATNSFAKWMPTLPTINLNTINPFASATKDNAKPSSDSPKSKDAAAAKAQSTNKRSFLSTTAFATSSPANGNENTLRPSRDASPARSNTMFAEPDTRSTSEADSLEDEQRQKALKKSNKPKTRFSVCHTPPEGKVKQRLHRRPRSLLQLHKLSPNARPVPAIEVVPSANFSVRLTRAITKVFKAKHGLCTNDLVVLRAEKYVAVDDEKDSELQDAKDIVGLICKGRKQDKEEAAAAKEGKARICMASGAEWEAYTLMNGGYEFFSTDEHGLGLTVRWVPKKNKDGSKATQKDGSKKFNFSTISPNSRRHPVIAALSKTSIEVNDTYKMPDPSAATPLSTPKQNSTSALAEAMEGEGDGHEQCETDDALREIITMTAIWVTFKEGWSPSFKYEDVKETGQRAASAMSAQNSPSKASFVGSPVNTPPGSPAQVPQLEKRNSVKSVGSSILRRSSMLSKGNRASQASVPEEDIIGGTLGRSESVKKTGRARGDSTSTVLVHRAASNRRKNNQQATWRPDLLSAQHQLQETSQEDLRSSTPKRNDTVPAEIWDSPLSTPGQVPRRKSVFAEPLIPGTPESLHDEDSAYAVPDTPPTSVPNPGEDEGKRVSDATTETKDSERSTEEAAVVVPKQPNGATKASNGNNVMGGKKEKGRKKGGWRRLLCMSSQEG